MTGKQRFISAMNFKKPDDYVSMYELEFQIYSEYVGKEPIIGFEYGKLSKKEKEKALHTNAEIFVETAKKAGHDMIRDVASYWEIAPGEPAALWLPEIEDRVNQLKAIKKLAGDDYFIIGTVSGPLAIPDGNHIYDFAIQLSEQPEEIHAECEKFVRDAYELQSKFLEAGADGIMNACDVAFNSGTFMSPQHMDEFFFPYFNRWG